ncbi:MAG TPA: outer membrane beta-barrel protein [Bryobacteraceae bacterium]
MRRAGVRTAIVLLSFAPGHAQHLSYGVAVGTALTKDFNNYSFPYAPGIVDFERPGGRGIIVGPILEWRFSPHFSVEGDGLFRELRYEGSGGNHNPTVTWEFPVLAKYRFRASRLQPFIEAGPAFRTTGNLNANPSHLGVAAGAGLGLRFSRLTIEPTLRYTRWQPDPSPYGIESRPDQIELLAAFSYSPGSDEHPFGSRIFIGALC